MRAVTDAGPLIHLSWIDRLDLLHLLFDEVIAPAAVRDEVLRADPNIPGVIGLREAFAAPVTGTLGILRTARDRGLIPAALPLLVELRLRGFRISAELEERIRQEEATAERAE